VNGVDGQKYSKYVAVTVKPPKPVLSSVRVQWHTTDDNKDHDTTVTVNLNCGGGTIASVSGQWGEFGDNSDSGWKNFNIIEARKKEQILGACQVQLIEAPVGHDEWHANMTVVVTFSDGSTKQYGWGVDVDYDRTTLSWPI
jgi:hypothetical protein